MKVKQNLKIGLMSLKQEQNRFWQKSLWDKDNSRLIVLPGFKFFAWQNPNKKKRNDDSTRKTTKILKKNGKTKTQRR